MHQWIERAVSRLLDALRLHELGLRPRLRALAPGARSSGSRRRRSSASPSSDTLLPGDAVGPAGRRRCSTTASTSTTRLAARAGRAPDPRALRRERRPAGPGSARLAAARIEANAARAIDAGLGTQGRRATPPPLYSYDPDIGRLAVTTPTYNTAIVAVNQRAFPYGGLDLARLFDGKQDVAANIGGRPPASFGLLVRDVGGRRVIASQVGRVAGRAGVDARCGSPRRRRARARSRRPRSAARTPGPFTRPARDRHRVRHARAARCASRTASRATGSRRAGPSTRRVRQRPLHRRRAVPELGRTSRRVGRRGAARRRDA